MPLLNDGVVVIESQGATTEAKGILQAYRDSQGWWAGLIASADSVPGGAELVGRKVQIRAAEGAATAQVSGCVKLLAPMPTVQLLMRGEGEFSF